MNLFRSEEHVKNWSLYDPVSEEAIMPVADWDKAINALSRGFLEPDRIARTEEYVGAFLAKLQELGRTGSFWIPG
jgi:hypothetical protein